MAKLNWEKASLRELDPARVQREVDFALPDPPVLKKKRKGAFSVSSIWATALSAAAKARKQLKASQTSNSAKGGANQQIKKPKRVSKPTARAVNRSDGKRHHDVKSRVEARTAHQQRNLSKARALEAATAAKKKTHLQAWAENQDGLQSDRGSLRRKWRDRLLNRSTED